LKETFTEQCLPQAHKVGGVHLKDVESNPPNGSTGFENRPVPPEVVVPFVSPGIEKPRQFPREGIDAREVRPFVPVAVNASQGQVSEHGWSAMLTGNDVVDFKGHREVSRGKAAVFANALGTPPDLANQPLVHGFV
jgi:hypothetical protein